MQLIIGLFLAGGLAGFIDAIAGGGGLITVPTLLLVGLRADLALGTNKGQSVFGSGTSLRRFWGSPLLDRQRAYQSFPPALAGAAAGALLVSRIDPKVLTPVVMGLLTMAAVLMLVQRPPAIMQPRRERSFGWVAGVAFVLAAYDGFFGPGTGTFLILAYAWLWRDSLDSASANAKVVNFASNLAAMATFAWKGLILWQYALPMAAGQVVGGWLGAHLTVRIGRQLVRYTVVAVCLGLIGRLAWQLMR